MAERIDGLPKSNTGKFKYPWNEWTDGTAWLAEPGVDFTVDMHAFRTILYAKAKSMGMHVKTRSIDGKLAFQFYR